METFDVYLIGYNTWSFAMLSIYPVVSCGIFFAKEKNWMNGYIEWMKDGFQMALGTFVIRDNKHNSSWHKTPDSKS